MTFQRPSNKTLAVATVWAGVLVTRSYALAEVAGWITLVAVLVMASFKPISNPIVEGR